MSPPRIKGELRYESDLGKCDFANQLGPNLAHLKRGETKLNIKNYSNALIGNNYNIEREYEKSAARVKRDISPL